MASDSGDNGGKKRRKKKKDKKDSHKRASKKKSMKEEEADRERMERIRSENPSVAGDFIFKTMLERDPRKRRIKPAVDRILESIAIETSSDDSDFDPGDKLSKSKGKKSIEDSDISESDEDGHQDMDMSSEDEDYDYEMDSKRKAKKSKDIGLASLFKDDSSMAESSSQDNTAFSKPKRNMRPMYQMYQEADQQALTGPRSCPSWFVPFVVVTSLMIQMKSSSVILVAFPFMRTATE